MCISGFVCASRFGAGTLELHLPLREGKAERGFPLEYETNATNCFNDFRGADNGVVVDGFGKEALHWRVVPLDEHRGNCFTSPGEGDDLTFIVANDRDIYVFVLS